MICHVIHLQEKAEIEESFREQLKALQREEQLKVLLIVVYRRGNEYH